MAAGGKLMGTDFDHYFQAQGKDAKGNPRERSIIVTASPLVFFYYAAITHCLWHIEKEARDCPGHKKALEDVTKHKQK
eukprot:gene3447-3142_t